MQWDDEGVVLRLRRHGESDAVAVALTFEHGRHAGLVKGGAGRRHWPTWQPGNRLELSWVARTADQLGRFSGELTEAHGGRLLSDPHRLAGLASACAMLDACLAEREPHPQLYAGLVHLLRTLDAGPDWPAGYVRFELLLLQELGFGLQLDRCAVTGRSDALDYVSPRTGRAVSTQAAGAYRDRLLPLPPFLHRGHAASSDEITQGLRLVGHFFARHIFHPTERHLPHARDRLAALFASPAAPDEPGEPSP